MTQDPSSNQELRARSGMLAALVKSSPVAILVLDLDRRVTMWNPACERIFGWTAEEVLGGTYPLVPPGGEQAFDDLFRTVIGGRGFTGVEVERAGRDGRPIIVSISTAPLYDDHGAITGAMAILEDVTERKHLEARYQQAARMEAVGRLAGGIAHDFNNALTVILAYCDTLQRTHDPDRGLDDVRKIEQAARRAAELTRQLLAFSRQQVLRQQVLDLNEAVLESTDLLQRLIGEDIAVRVRLCDERAHVRADAHQIERMLMNLAANGRDAMPDGGVLSLETHLETDGDRFVVLAVRDTGVGMSHEVLEHIFEPFYTTKSSHGTGLGLASVYGVVHQSGGDIDVTSSVDGTEFRIRLPLADADTTPEVPPPPTPTPSARQARILVVEDDDDVRAVVCDALAAWGYDVVQAVHGEDATRLIDEGHRFDLLLTDVVMKQVNGRQVADHFLRSHATGKIMYMSGYTDDEVLRRGVAAGAAFIQKPFTARGLIQAVRDALDSPG